MVTGCVMCLSTVFLFGLRDFDVPATAMPPVCKVSSSYLLSFVHQVEGWRADSKWFRAETMASVFKFCPCYIFHMGIREVLRKPNKTLKNKKERHCSYWSNLVVAVSFFHWGLDYSKTCCIHMLGPGMDSKHRIFLGFWRDVHQNMANLQDLHQQAS